MIELLKEESALGGKPELYGTAHEPAYDPEATSAVRGSLPSRCHAIMLLQNSQANRGLKASARSTAHSGIFRDIQRPLHRSDVEERQCAQSFTAQDVLRHGACTMGEGRRRHDPAGRAGGRLLACARRLGLSRTVLLPPAAHTSR